mmetsp:Transcript_18322/g.56423  ORF Transcript_18322/g.56423 Transcript_18322/m.56423 type:complete len:426 (-) Transcript_18322:39-1316(-)
MQKAIDIKSPLNVMAGGARVAAPSRGRLVTGALLCIAALALGRLLLASETLSIATAGFGDPRLKWGDAPCKDGAAVPPVDASSRVLVTGGAGFIGMSLMASLGARDEKRRPAVVVGIDSFNDYYAPAMKRGRAQRLQKEFGYEVVEGDVCQADLIDALFKKHKFTHVVHLAAQAGVRYSITHPMTYVHNNLECVVSLLDYVAHKEPQPAYVYASSSSVYGLNKQIPFSERHAIDHPANLYGTSKFADEQIAAAYHNIHGLKSVGLRFFTVYGPWGRPDMAVSLFTNKIENGETITLFNGGEMWRDFTYVDDIVDGIERSMEYCSDNAAVFNLGNSKPVKLGYFLAQIEQRLGVKAKFKYQASNAEIKETYADVSKAKELLGYAPKTSIEDGLDSFMAWYKKLDKPTRDEWAGGRFKGGRRVRRRR